MQKIFLLALLLAVQPLVRAQNDSGSLQQQNALLKQQLKLQQEQYDYLKKINEDILNKKFEALKSAAEASEKNQWIVIIASVLGLSVAGGIALYKTSSKAVLEAVGKIINERVDIIIDSLADYEMLKRFKREKTILVISNNEYEKAEMSKMFTGKDKYDNIKMVVRGSDDAANITADVVLINDYEGLVENSYVKNIHDTCPNTYILWFTANKGKGPLKRLSFSNAYATLPGNLIAILKAQDKAKSK